MNCTILKCLSAAACLAASAGLVAQSAGTTEVRVVRPQGPASRPPLEKSLVEVIDLLDADKLTEEQQKKAKAVLQEVVERLRHDQKAGRPDGVWLRAPRAPGEARAPEAEPELAEIVEDMEVTEAPRAVVRLRKMKVRDDGADADDDKEEHEVRVVRGQALRFAPRDPRAAQPPRAPEMSRRIEVQFHGEGHGDDGDRHENEAEIHEGRAKVLRALELHMARGEHEQADKELRFLIDRKRAAARRQAIEWHEVHEEDHGDESRGDAEAGGSLRLQLDRKGPPVAEVRGFAREQPSRLAQRVEVESLDDVTEEHDLRTMIDEMRAEMREVRALMERIRQVAPKGDDPRRPRPQ